MSETPGLSRVGSIDDVISVQLYSARDALFLAPEANIRGLAKAFKKCELAGTAHVAAPTFQGFLAAAGMPATGAHYLTLGSRYFAAQLQEMDDFLSAFSSLNRIVCTPSQVLVKQAERHPLTLVKCYRTYTEQIAEAIKLCSQLARPPRIELHLYGIDMDANVARLIVSRMQEKREDFNAVELEVLSGSVVYPVQILLKNLDNKIEQSLKQLLAVQLDLYFAATRRVDIPNFLTTCTVPVSTVHVNGHKDGRQCRLAKADGYWYRWMDVLKAHGVSEFIIEHEDVDGDADMVQVLIESRALLAEKL